jgi:hypothetical protein
MQWGRVSLLVVVAWTLLPITRADEVAQAKSTLQWQLNALALVRDYVEAHDLPQIEILRRSTERTLNSILQEGLGNQETLHRYQKMVTAYLHSTAFFRRIDTAHTHTVLQALIDTNAKTASASGVIKAQAGQRINAVFSQIGVLLRSLPSLGQMDPAVMQKLNDLRGPLGRLLGQSVVGDTLSVVAEARLISRKIEVLYPELEKIKGQQGEDTLLEILSLNESFLDLFGISPTGSDSEKP